MQQYARPPFYIAPHYIQGVPRQRSICRDAMFLWRAGRGAWLGKVGGVGKEGREGRKEEGREGI